ncbi:MAG: PLP-dependent aminotransferase family protein [Chloroflexaceae bacterium]|nr:PLP-dependent aminotransferase family protein [Chloroflexaceae bacterium]NJO06400.1 PLP-dependent aminotransferase family protein [Chloroflexaceae bacterium]
MRLPDVQLHLRPGIIEFGWGHPDPALLPLDDLRRAARMAFIVYGADALAYGAEQGPGSLIAELCDLLAQRGVVPPSPETIFVTAGVSHAIDLLCTLYTRPGDVALVQAPVYHLALKILRDHGLTLVPVASDEHGLQPDALEAALHTLAQDGQHATLLYTIPTFANPTGSVLSAERRAAVVDIAVKYGLLVLEDDVYYDLWYDTPPPPPLAAYPHEGRVVRLGSFSKIVAPGLRLGWLQADPTIVQRCVTSGVIDSGGGINHLTAHIATSYVRHGYLTRHIDQLRASYRTRRDTLLAALAAHLPETCQVYHPGGGFFVWLSLPEDVDSAAFRMRAEAAGVSYLSGDRFYSNEQQSNAVRLAFSLLSPADLEEGAARLGRVLSE